MDPISLSHRQCVCVADDGICFLQHVLAALLVKNPPAMWKTWVHSLSWVDPWRRKWQSTPVFLPGELQGQRSLAGHSPWGRRESDTTERLTPCLSLVDAHGTFPAVTIKSGSRFCCMFLMGQNHSLAENQCHKGLGYMMLRC